MGGGVSTNTGGSTRRGSTRPPPITKASDRPSPSAFSRRRRRTATTSSTTTATVTATAAQRRNHQRPAMRSAPRPFGRRADGEEFEQAATRAHVAPVPATAARRRPLVTARFLQLPPALGHHDSALLAQ